VICLVRHGQTALNRAKVLQGRSDPPLNEIGRQQARKIGAWLRTEGIVFDRVYSSPLQRAIQTAKQIAGDIPIQTDERLIEMDYGPYEGLDLRRMPPEVLAFFSDFVHMPAPPGMEPLSSVTNRLGQFLEERKAEAGEGNLLISTHAIAMKGALEYLTPESHGAYWGKHIGNCAVYAAEWNEGAASVLFELAAGLW